MTNEFTDAAGNVLFTVDITAGDTSGIQATQELAKSLQGASNATQDNSDKVQQNNFHMSGWLITLTNLHSTVRNLTQAMEAVAPQFAVIGEAASGIGFGLAGIAQGGAAAALGLASIGSTAVNVAVQATAAFAQFTNQLYLQSQAAGLTQQQTLQLDTAMQITGGSVNQLTFAATHLDQALQAQASGSSTKASDALNRLGITSTDTYGALMQVATALQNISDPTERATAAEDIFGLRGREVVGMLTDLVNTLPQANDLLQKHSDIIANGDAIREKYNAQVADLKLTWMDFASRVAPAVVNALNLIDQALPGGSATGKSTQAYYQNLWAGAFQNNVGKGPLGSNPEDTADINTWPYATGTDITGIPESVSGAHTGLPGQVWDDSTKSWVDPEATSAQTKGNTQAFQTGQLDNSDMIANPFLDVFNQLTQDLPKFTLNLGNVKDTIQQWSAVDDQFASRIQSIKSQIDAQRAAQDMLTLSGQQYQLVMDANGNQHKILTAEYQASQDKVKALTAAENLLNAERIDGTTQYSATIQDLTKAIAAAAAEAESARRAFAPFLASSVASAQHSGGVYVTGISADGSSYGAIVGPGGTAGVGGTITSIGGQAVTPGGPSLVPQAADGGYVGQTGLAVIHKGETVVPAGGGITVNLYNYGVQTGALDQLVAALNQLQRTGKYQ